MIDVEITKTLTVSVLPKNSSESLDDYIEVEEHVWRLGRFSSIELAAARSIKFSDGSIDEIYDVLISEGSGGLKIHCTGDWERLERLDHDDETLRARCNERLAEMIAKHVNAGWEVVRDDAEG